MSTRFTLHLPTGDVVVRDVHAGRWVEPAGDPDDQIGADLWALPGLVDAHAHLATRELTTRPGDLDDAMERADRALHAGVNLILDKGWTDDTTCRLIDLMPASERPEIEAAATIITTPDGYFPDFGIEVSPDQLAAVVERQAAVGRGWVKLIGDWPRKGVGPVTNFDESQLRQVVEVAGRSGAKVAIHAMARDTPSLAVGAGVHSIEHGLFLTEDDLARLGDRAGMWVPTLLRNESTMAQLGPDSSGGRLFVEGLDNVRRLLPLAVEAGVHVLAGTDLIGEAADVAAEALRLIDYGLTPAQAVAAVSTEGYAATGRDPGFAPGSPADAVFFPANPVVEPRALAHPVVVMRLGRTR